MQLNTYLWPNGRIQELNQGPSQMQEIGGRDQQWQWRHELGELGVGGPKVVEVVGQGGCLELAFREGGVGGGDGGGRRFWPL